MDLKEKIKKKNARIRKLNEKIKKLEDELNYTNKDRWDNWNLYRSVRHLLPKKLYKITYEYLEFGKLKCLSESIEACHFEEAKIIIRCRLNLEHHEINFIEILQIAS